MLQTGCCSKNDSDIFWSFLFHLNENAWLYGQICEEGSLGQQELRGSRKDRHAGGEHIRITEMGLTESQGKKSCFGMNVDKGTQDVEIKAERTG